MIISADVMRSLLLLCWTGMVLMAVFFLRSRRMTFFDYLGWGLLAVLVPFLGAFLVILMRPGKSLYRRSRRKRTALSRFRRIHITIPKVSIAERIRKSLEET